MPNDEKRQRVQLDFSDRQFARLETLCEEKDVSKPEVLRAALHAYEWLLEQSNEKRILEVRSEDGELVFRLEANFFFRL